MLNVIKNNKYKIIFCLVFILIIILIIIEFAIKINTKNFYIKEDKISLKVLKNHGTEINDVAEEKYVAKNILQTYKHSKLPKYIKNNLIKLNPEWNYNFYDDNQVKNFLKKEYPSIVLEKFNSFTKGAHKADLFRVCWLYKHGGVYIDVDVEFFEPLNNLIDNIDGDFFTMPMTEAKYNRKRLLNCFIIANKGNPLLKECIINILKIDNKDLLKIYHLILFTMQHTLKDKIKYHFTERNDKENDLWILEGNDWHIYDKNNKNIANSRYKNYDRNIGFVK